MPRFQAPQAVGTQLDIAAKKKDVAVLEDYLFNNSRPRVVPETGPEARLAKADILEAKIESKIARRIEKLHRHDIQLAVLQAEYVGGDGQEDKLCRTARVSPGVGAGHAHVKDGTSPPPRPRPRTPSRPADVVLNNLFDAYLGDDLTTGAQLNSSRKGEQTSSASRTADYPRALLTPRGRSGHLPDSRVGGMSRPMDLKAEPAIKWSYSLETRSWAKAHVMVVLDDRRVIAKGSMRQVLRLFEVDTAANNLFLFAAKFPRKSFGVLNPSVFFSDVRMQAVADSYAQEFNKTGVSPHKVAFLPTQVVHLTKRKKYNLCNIEPLLSGHYRKYNDNDGGLFSGQETPQAFSHFTYEASNHDLLICDIQGVEDCWTDPQIHSVSDSGFGLGNFGRQGIARFFTTHRCNAMCKKLGLPQSRLGAAPGGLDDTLSSSATGGQSVASDATAKAPGLDAVVGRPAGDARPSGEPAARPMPFMVAPPADKVPAFDGGPTTGRGRSAGAARSGKQPKSGAAAEPRGQGGALGALGQQPDACVGCNYMPEDRDMKAAIHAAGRRKAKSHAKAAKSPELVEDEARGCMEQAHASTGLSSFGWGAESRVGSVASTRASTPLCSPLADADRGFDSDTEPGRVVPEPPVWSQQGRKVLR